MRGRRPIPEPGSTQAPDPPDGLTDVERAEWARVVSELIQLGTVQRTDRATLLLWVQAFGRREEALRVRSQGWLAVVRQAESVLLRLLPELGLSPSARRRLEEPGEEVPLLD